MEEAYWKWPESSWLSDTIDWKKAEKITAGIDIGTTSSQAVILCDGKLFGYSNLHTVLDFPRTTDLVLKEALASSGMTRNDIGKIFSTGWGSGLVDYADGSMDEIHCHAKGAHFLFGPGVETVVDLGGQTTKAIRVYEWGRPRDFMINDKCATGMGRNIELMADIMQVSIEEIGERSLQVESDPEPVSTTCYPFANSETVGLFQPEFRANDLGECEVLASYLFAVAWRILGVIGKLQPLDIGEMTVFKDLAFTGGLAKNAGITRRLERELKVKAVESKYDPMLAGAIGAALAAAEPE